VEEAVNPDYRLYHPKWHRRRIPIFWWLGKRSYIRFIARELTSVFVAYCAVLLLLQTWMLGRGEAAYARFSEWLASPPLVGFHLLTLLAVVFHTVTWLGLAPTALVISVRGRRVPSRAVLLAHYAAWAVASGVVAWALLGGS
jgi:fumarate reductase subunit C